MALIACTIRNISLITITNGSMYKGGIDMEGLELPDVQCVASFEPDHRTYYCDNCNKKFDGSETFEEVKKHLGTFPIDAK